MNGCIWVSDLVAIIPGNVLEQNDDRPLHGPCLLASS